MTLSEIQIGISPLAEVDLKNGKHRITLFYCREYRTVIKTLIHESIHIALDDLHLYRASIMLDNIASKWHNKYERYGL